MVTKGNACPKLPLHTNITQTTSTSTTSTASPTMKHQSRHNPQTPKRLEETRQNNRVKEAQQKEAQQKEAQQKETQQKEAQQKGSQLSSKQKDTEMHKKKTKELEKKKEDASKKKKLADEKKIKEVRNAKKDKDKKIKEARKRRKNEEAVRNSKVCKVLPSKRKGFITTSRERDYVLMKKSNNKIPKNLTEKGNKSARSTSMQIKEHNKIKNHKTRLSKSDEAEIERVMKAKTRAKNAEINLERRKQIFSKQEKGEELSPEDHEYITKFLREKATKQKWQKKQKGVPRTEKVKLELAFYQRNYSRKGPLYSLDPDELRAKQMKRKVRFNKGQPKRERKRKKQKKQQQKESMATTTSTHTSSTSTPPTTRVLKGFIVKPTTSNQTGHSATIKMGDILQFQKILRDITNSYLCKFKVHKGNCDCACIKNLMWSVTVDIEKSFVIHMKDNTSTNPIGIAMIIPSDNDNGGVDVGDLANENWLVNNVLNVEEGKETRKYSMAQCGLQIEKNAFVYIAGSDIFLKQFIQESSNTLKEKEANGINRHNDTCNYLVRLTVNELKNKAFHLIRCKLTDQGLGSKLQGHAIMEFGPHLKSAITSTHFNYDINGQAASVLVMVKNNNEQMVPRIVLDIPGGKRELGETTIDCAMRKVYEEAHIRLDCQMLDNAIKDDIIEKCGTFFFVRE
jgi:hypothetical protein